ncbi:MAG: conjugal transfer protein TraR [Candidatus Kapaibacterium sp.]
MAKTTKKIAAKKPAAKKIVAAKKPAAKKIVAAKKPVAKKTVKKEAGKIPAAKTTSKKVAPKTESTKVNVVKAKKLKVYNNKNNRKRYSGRDLLHFKNILIEEKAKIIASARANMKTLVDSESGEYVGDDLSYASHMAEQGSDEMEREKNYMFVQRDEKYLGHIEEALTRIDQGTYGVCADCIEEPKNLCKTCPLIPKERLEIVPITQHCIECKNFRS